MENNNGYSKYVAIIALLLSVVGVSLGFAAFSNTVEIKAGATVNYDLPDPDKPGQLSTDPDSQDDGTVTPTVNPACAADDNCTADPASLTHDQIDGIHATFTAPGQSATYSFYGYNGSSFVSYLNSVVFGTKSCLAETGTNQDYVDEACPFIKMTVTVGGSTFTATNNNVNGHTVNSEASEPITVTIEYAADDGGSPATPAKVADGPFEVDFGSTMINYGTAD